LSLYGEVRSLAQTHNGNHCHEHTTLIGGFSSMRTPVKNGPPLRVGWDVRLVSRNRTGSGVYARCLGEQLASHPQVELLPLDGWNWLDHKRGLPWRAARVLSDIAWTQVNVPIAAARVGAAVLHAPAYLAPVWGSLPLVVTAHDLSYRHFPEHFARWWVQYLNLVMPRVLQRAERVITVSEHAKRDIAAAYAIDPARIRVIYPGVDHRRFHPGATLGADTLARSYGIRCEYVLHVGALVARKNIPLLLEAVALLRDRGKWKSRQVVLVGGDTPGMIGAEAVHQAVDRLKLADEVVFADHVPDEHLASLYTQSAVLAFPSRFEGFGLPLVEAMACGVPVVAVGGSSVSEVVGNAGLLVGSDDPEAFATALLSALEDSTLRKELRARGLQRATDFTWERSADETIAVYHEAIAAHNYP
jgi:glycosyltransferase involved in cell wall biosynthesis